jgi:flagellar protein FliO/FliZ
MDQILSWLFILIVFGSILFLAFVTSKYIAGKSSQAMKGKYIKIVETVSLGMDKRLHLIKVDKQFILIASCSKTIEYLTTLTLEEIEKDGEADSSQTFDFKQIFEKYIKSYKAKKDRTITLDENMGLGDGVNHSFKSNLDRLKALTRKVGIQNLENKDDMLKEDITNEK